MRRGVGAFLVVGVLVPLVFAANASAQGSVLQVSPSTARPGQAVTATGGSFSRNPGTTTVKVRLSTRDGQVLQSASPDSNGQISVTFPVPASLEPGTYLILATQRNDNNRATAFTPARTTLQVTAGAASSSAPGGGPGGGSGPPLQLLGGAIVLVLLAGGCLLAVRRLRTVNRALGS